MDDPEGARRRRRGRRPSQQLPAMEAAPAAGTDVGAAGIPEGGGVGGDMGVDDGMIKPPAGRPPSPPGSRASRREKRLSTPKKPPRPEGAINDGLSKAAAALMSMGKESTVAPSANLPAETTGYFLVMATGQLESGQFLHYDNLYCKYSFSYGRDWEVRDGLENGLTQISTKSLDGEQLVVWNFPIEITFKSTNAFGWPQINISVYSIDSLGRDLVRGYGSMHLPIASGRHTQYLRMFKPESTSKLQQLTSWLSGMPPEFIDPKFTSKGEGREVTRVKSHGAVKIRLDITMKELTTFGYTNTVGKEHIVR
eukprot:GFYU01000624.1.p1 GENE.GFYU01000624.1~~GFYU01000624.1.p1  ORF type:complete len:310 (+),score=68.36 GFYU01000624.1:448-1377(+)